ncbi:hypothetical protein [Acidisoma sp. 7E03]
MRDYVIETLANGALLVKQPPDYLFGLVFILPGFITLGFFLYRVFNTRTAFPLWGALIFSVPLFLAGLFVMTTGSLTLDKASNTALFHKTVWLWHDDFTVPLDQLRYARVRDRGASDYIVIGLGDGGEISFGDANQDGGKVQAAFAINRYLGREGAP